MLIAFGPGLTGLQDYTQQIWYDTINVATTQGDKIDKFVCTLHDFLNTVTIAAEDDAIVLDETDVNGWPTVNLLANPSFEGTYASGIAPSWTGVNTGAAGVTASANTTAKKVGSAAQQVAISNVANGTNITVEQKVTLPRDENQSVIGTPSSTSFGSNPLPFYLSVYLYTPTSFSGAFFKLAIDWYTASNGYITTTSGAQLTNTSGNFTRVSISTVAPSNASYCYVYVQIVTTSATNSGTLVIDGAQFEYATYAYARSSTYPLAQLDNDSFTHQTSGATICDGWHSDGAIAGTTYALNAGGGQKIICSGVAASGATQAVAQSGIPLNPAINYTLALTYQITASLSANAKVRFGFEWHDANGNYLGNTTQDSAPGLTAGGLKSATLSVGPWGSVFPPAGSAQCKIYAGLVDGTDVTWSGTLVVLSVVVTAAPVASQSPYAETSALRAYMYPTPYCDNNQPGCYTDTGATGLYYRHLRLYGGYVRDPLNDWTKSVECEIEITCGDYTTMLGEAPATLIVKQQQDSAAIAQAVTYAQNQGFLVGLDASTFVSSIAVIDYHIYNWQTTRDVIDHIANQTVAAWWVDAYKRLHYVPALSVSAPFGISDHPDGATSYACESLTIERDSTQSLTQKVIEGSTQLSVAQTYTATGNGATKSFTINSSLGVSQVDSITVAGTQQTVGLASVNTYAQGYAALLDPATGIVTFNVAPANGAAIVIMYRFLAPVLVRLHAPKAESSTGTVRRKIHQHEKRTEITSQQAAIDRANADLSANQRARPIATMVINSLDCPVVNQLRAGMAIPITHAGAKLTGTLYQIVEIDITPLGNGYYTRTLKLGFYKPNFILYQFAQQRDQDNSDTAAGSDTVLQDVLSASDGWAMGDSIVATTNTSGVWGDGTHAGGTWGGPSTWG